MRGEKRDMIESDEKKEKKEIDILEMRIEGEICRIE